MQRVRRIDRDYARIRATVNRILDEWECAPLVPCPACQGDRRVWCERCGGTGTVRALPPGSEGER
jgi:hypothetical protein